MLAKKVTALFLSAALVLTLLAGCGGSKALSQVIADLLSGLYTNVDVEVDSDLTAALKKAAAEGGTEDEILTRLVNNLNITGGSITGVLMVNGEANISGGSFNYIINYGTLKMTGGTVNSSVGSCIRNQGTAELSNVRITESTVDGIGITNDGEASLTLGDGVNISAYIGVSKGDVSINGNVTIDAVKYGVNPSLVTLTGTLRLYNPASHPICGASCSHDTPHSSV